MIDSLRIEDWVIVEDSLVRLGGKTGIEKLPRESSESD